MYMRFALLGYFLCAVVCNWTEPLLIQTNGSIYESGFYLHPSGDILVFYSKNDSICYKTAQGNNLSKELCLPQSKPVKDLSVTSYNDGSSIFIAFAANRTFSGKECTINDTSGCTDIYYTESRNAGKTWTKTLPIDRKNLSDAVQRTSPKLLLIEETGRLFLFYCVPDEDINYLYKVDRPKGSLVFSAETKIYSNRYPMHQLKVEYINVWDDITIFVCFEHLYWLTMLYTGDTGRTWSKPIPLQYVSDLSNYVMTKPNTGDTLFLATVDRFLLTLYAIDNEGSKTSESFYHLANWTGYKPFVAAYPEDGLRYLISSQIQGKQLSTYVYNIGKNIMTSLDSMPPASPSDKTIYVEDDMYRISVLHNVTNNLYLSTLSVPK